MHEYTKIMPGVIQCNDCGAHADTKENVVHHASCKPGESKVWEKLYAQDNMDITNGDYLTLTKRSQTAEHKVLMKRGRREFHKK